jgi:hypothetical protein
MAMTKIAPRSSMMANAVMNTLSDAGILFLNKAITPRAKAISVAIGMPTPSCVAVPRFRKK